MKHYIIVKYNELVTDKAGLQKEIDALFQKILVIDGIEKVQVIPNIVDRDNRYDLMICITMLPESLEVYDASIYHRQWKEQFGKYILNKTIFDAGEDW